MKSKVIIALLLACCALFLAWGISNIAFKEMLGTLENISAPSEKLRLVNVVSRKISSMDQLQREQILQSPESYRIGIRVSRQLRNVLDTLGRLYAGDSAQLARIFTIKRLLTERDKQFISYLRIREKVINDNAVSNKVRDINSIVSRSNAMSDSTVLASEERSSTTTIYPEEKERGFLARLFGKKRNDEGKSIKIVSEERVKRDTIALAAEDSIARELERSLRMIDVERKKKSARFLKEEAVLAKANANLIRQMQDLLGKVENEVVSQIEVNSVQAKRVVNTGIDTMGIIMVVFGVITVVLLYLILTDITKSAKYRHELELARDEAEYHGKAKQRFLSNMSHEIRTPLQSIIGYSELIKDQDIPQKKHVQAIRHSSEHLLQIVNQILDYNRIVSGKFTFNREVFDMWALMNEVVSVIRPQAAYKGLTLETFLEIEGARYVEGDAFRLKQILYNLLGNAVKFTDSGEVLLRAFYKKKDDEAFYTFSVKDTGIGFSEQESQRIFGEFEQGESVATNHNAGTGLGLAIVKSLTEAQNGRIYVKSSPGKGSLFTVYLAYKITAPPVIVPDDLKKPNVFEGLVWIVDDDRLILDLCGIIFKKNSIPFHRFETPSALLANEVAHDLRFVFMDIRMPEMDGITLCRLLREKVGNLVKIYAITAQVLPDEREFLLENGFDGLLMKPFREEELLSILSNNSQQENTGTTFDFTTLKKMTMGDEKLLQAIIVRFKTDSIDDIALATQAMKDGRISDVILIVHRLAGRIAQIGHRELSGTFRKLEIRIGRSKVLNEELANELSGLLSALEMFCYSIS